MIRPEEDRDFERLVNLPLKEAYAECRASKAKLSICQSKAFWLRRLERITGEDLKDLFDEPTYEIQGSQVFSIESELRTYSYRYHRALAYLGFYYPGSEKFVSPEICFLQSLRSPRRHSRLFNHFLPLISLPKIKATRGQWVNVFRDHRSDDPKVLKEVATICPLELQVQYLVGDKIDRQGEEIIFIPDILEIGNAEKAVETGLFVRDPYPTGWQHFQSEDTNILDLYYETATLDNLPSDPQQQRRLLILAISDNNMNIVDELLDLMDDTEPLPPLTTGFLLYDPRGSLELVLERKPGLIEIHLPKLTEISILDNATQSFLYLVAQIEPIDSKTHINLLRLAIISSNLPAFGVLRERSYYRELRRSLVLCKSPEIWRQFLGYYEISELPPIPESIRKFL